MWSGSGELLMILSLSWAVLNMFTVVCVCAYAPFCSAKNPDESELDEALQNVVCTM